MSGMFNRFTSGGGGGGQQPPQGYNNYSRPQASQSGSYGGGGGGVGGHDESRGGYGAPAQRVPVGGRGPAPQQQSRGAMQLRPEKSHEGNAFAFGNMVSVSPVDFGNEESFYVLVNGQYVFTARPTPRCPPGQIGFTDNQRSWARIGLGPSMVVSVERYQPLSGRDDSGYMYGIDCEVSFKLAKKTTDVPYDQQMLNDIFVHTYENQVLAPGQILLMDVNNIPLELKISNVELVDLSGEKDAVRAASNEPDARGIITKQTQVNFYKNPQSPIKLKASLKKPSGTSIIAPNFKFESLGIGGLDKEFETIFRKAFASRLLPLGLMEQLGTTHVKGLLLYGPPGTGKTLIARQIGKMLNSREPKIINGPEVLNKFVGQSEENIRKLFADAEKEYKEKGDDSELHVIIFDELDAVCKQRGSGAGGGTGVGDSVVNQLLSKMDGVDALNNILLIGMTNRKDMIDEALLRPGRLEVHLEIGLPDERGRVDILKIHTSKMRENNRLDRDVDFLELARATKNFSGAEIAGLVRAAISWAQSRHVKVGTMASLSDDITDIKIRMEDFQRALDNKEIVPLFGVAEEELDQALSGGFFPFSDTVRRIMSEGAENALGVKEGDFDLFSNLIYGPPGSGKTAIAAKLALESDYSFVKFITPNNMVGMGEAQKVAYFDKNFRDADKSQISLIVIDDIESIIDWTPIGPRFSNNVMQALKVLIQKPPPKGRRRLVLATTSERGTLDALGLLKIFRKQTSMPNVLSPQELQNVIAASGAFSESDVRQIPTHVANENEGRVDVGIKDILSAIGQSKRDPNMAARFVEVLGGYVAASRGRALESA